MLLTKLHISTPGAQTVHRTALFEKLAAGLKAKVMLISAPAGFGKTTLLSDWILQQEIPAAWYSIDTNDNDAATFFSYVVTAIQKLYPDFGNNALELLHSPKLVSQESIVHLLLNEILLLPRHFLLVFDDFHLINKQDVLSLIAYFVEHLPPNLHLALLTRADPLLPLAKLRSQHQLVELRSADLSFSAEEINFLFNRKLKLNVSLSDVNSLTHKTEGWIAGLQLIALSLQGREDSAAFIQNFKGNNRYVMDYLIEEVLKIQTPEIKEFLIKTSLLEQLSAPLCNAVLGRDDSQAVLEMLEKNNMFIVSLDAERSWYRYHHLFRDLLRQRLLQKEKTEITRLHSKSSSWFEQNQLLDFAIDHLLQIQDYEKASQLLVKVVEALWEYGQHASIMKYGDQLPEALLKKHPEVGLYYAWVLFRAGEIHKATPILDNAEEITRQKINESHANREALRYQKKLLGKIAVALAHQYTFLGRPDLILKYGQVALENLSEEDPLWFSWGWYAVGMAQLANEKINESTESLKKALAYGKTSRNVYLISTVAIALAFNEGRLGHYKVSYNRSAELLEFLQENGYGDLVKTDWAFAVLYANMAAIQYFWAELDGAADNIKAAYALSLKEADITSKVLVLVIYSVILHGQGDMIGAEQKIKEIEAILQKNKVNPFLHSMYINWKANFMITQNQLDKARTFLEAHGVAIGNTISYAEEFRYMPLAMLLMMEYKVEEAFGLLSQLYEMASAQGRKERMIETKVLLSILFQAIGEKQKALDSLSESLAYAAADEILMYHLNYLEQIDPLLQEIFKQQARGKAGLPHPFINKLKNTIEKRRSQPPAPFDLTTRERETLLLMAENLSNQEIADKLFISLNTVKTRLKNLYAKLEVDTRTKAVEKAKQLRLI